MKDGTHATETSDAGDNHLVGRLRRLAAQTDPVPPVVQQAARASFAWRTVDAELARLVSDSFHDRRLAGVRGSDEPRLLSFDGAHLTVEVEVARVGLRRRIFGQLFPHSSPLAAARVQVLHAGGVAHCQSDELGRFDVDGLFAGPVVLRCRTAGAAYGRPVQTESVHL